MNISLQICGVLGLVCEPFLPNTSEKLKTIFNIKNVEWDSISKDSPIICDKIEKSSLLFRKIEDQEIELQLEKLNESIKLNE